MRDRRSHSHARRRTMRRAAVVVVAAVLAAGCNASGASKAGGQKQTGSTGTITLTFASANPGPVDNTFAAQLAKDSGGQIKLREVAYNYDAPDVDEQIAADLQSGKLDLGDVGSRAWETISAGGFQAYQEPFLVTSRELLDKAVTGPVASLLLGGLKTVGVTGLAIVPAGIRYL
jgi:ABC-type glycerol-3-phosphate transport system substrate-binding protein